MLSDLASLAAVLGIVAVVLQLRQVQKQRIRDFEGRFLQRYWGLMDRLPADVVLGSPPDGDASEKGRAVFAMYLRLCEDECEQRQLLWVSSVTWDIWADGIREQLITGPFAGLWSEEEERFADQFTMLRGVLGRRTDPAASKSRLTRWARGVEPGL